MSLLSFNFIFVGKFSLSFPSIAILARCNKIHDVIFSAVCNRVYVIYFKNNIRSHSSAILTSKSISLKNFKSYFFR